MCHSRTLNNKTNRAHERALRIIYNDHWSSFKSSPMKGEFEFLKFFQKSRVQNFPIKREGLIKYVVVLERGMSLTNTD